jgi:hypothetical protein
MKRTIAGLLAGLILGTVSTAVASSQWEHRTYGILCKSSVKTHSVICVPVKQHGYGVGISEDLVMIYNTRTTKIDYWKRQP